jgi:hypothetical protein
MSEGILSTIQTLFDRLTGLDPGIHALFQALEGVDGRVKPGQGEIGKPIYPFDQSVNRHSRERGNPGASDVRLPRRGPGPPLSRGRRRRAGIG